MLSLNDVKHLNGDALLSYLGLERRGGHHWVAAAVGGMAVGFLMGAGAAALLTPQTGQQLRGKLGQRLNGWKAEAGSLVESAKQLAHAEQRDA